MSFPGPTDPNNQAGSDPTWANNNMQMNGDVNQYKEDQAAMQADISALEAALSNMAEELKDHPNNAGMALMSFFNQILPDVLGVQQDQMNVLADSQNIASDLRSFVTSMQNDFNTGNKATQGDMTDLYLNADSLNYWTGYLSDKSNFNGKTAPLDPTNATQIQGMVTDIQNQFTHGSDGQGADWGKPSEMANDMSNWFATTPSGATPSNPEPQIKAIQGDLQQSNSAVSTQATTTQTQLQFFTNQYNQFVGVTNSLQQSFASENTASINNQKTS